MESKNFKIEITKYDTYALGVKFKKIAEDLASAYFTVKENVEDEPLIQKTLGAGISKIEDRPYKDEKTYKVQLQPIDTANLEIDVQYLYDLQVTIGNVVKTVISGFFVVKKSVTGNPVLNTAEIEVALTDTVETEVATVPATNGVEYEQDPVALAKIGDMATLNTANKETVVKAINEVKTNTDATIGDLSSLQTKEKTSLTKAINEIKDTQTTGTVFNAEKVNDLEIQRDKNGVLKIGDVIIPQKKPLWFGDLECGTEYAYLMSPDIEPNALVGKTLQFVIENDNCTDKPISYNTRGNNKHNNLNPTSANMYLTKVRIGNSLDAGGVCLQVKVDVTDSSHKLKAIYEIIE